MPSPPTGPQIPQPPSRTPREASRPPRPLPWRSLILVTVIFLAILALLDSPNEIGRWHRAAAEESWTEAKLAEGHHDPALAAKHWEKAFAQLEQALSWSPGDVNYLLARSTWQSQCGHQEAALEDCNQVIRELGEKTPLLELRMQIYQQLGRHADAVADAQQIAALSKTSGYPSRTNMLNTLAYVKAVGKIDLPEARKQADEAVRSAQALVDLLESSGQETSGYWGRLSQAVKAAESEALESEAKNQLCQVLDTRGFVHYQMGNYRQALADLNPAADGFSELVARTDVKLGIVRRASPDSRTLDIKLSGQRRALAVILYHRGLAQQKLGHSAAAASDLKRVREIIRREPDEKFF